MSETSQPGSILFLTVQMLSLKVIDLSCRLKSEDIIQDEMADKNWQK
jgi:hypothetical protein